MLRRLYLQKSIMDITNLLHLYIVSGSNPNSISYSLPKLKDFDGHWCSYVPVQENEFTIGYVGNLKEAIDYSRVLRDYKQEAFTKALQDNKTFEKEIITKGTSYSTIDKALKNCPWRVMINLEGEGLYQIKRDVVYWDDNSNLFYVYPADCSPSDILVVTSLVTFNAEECSNLLKTAEDEDLYGIYLGNLND